MDRLFTRIATAISTAAGQPQAFVVALLVILGWAASGPLFDYSDTWQLILNTGSSIITLLMVFLIQNSQNRDAAAMQAKLDELLRSIHEARAEFIGIEHLTDEEIKTIRSALEREVGADEGKSGTADDSVEQLIGRLK
ncbi:low affinity iron permease family protein [Sphingomonas sp. KRR8]|uniref:low affinity iron permease family protein n=1 Tax=Sphingomonas sp. KRR8 TaxID=2942996 RepID=UPI002020A9D4|nr:low affinity iron permease family protein [Sphingomonas sp. KRR8]URD62392.1 low affinity iron permease family protein [Sphingomonas sp. KRR8]